MQRVGSLTGSSRCPRRVDTQHALQQHQTPHPQPQPIHGDQARIRLLLHALNPQRSAAASQAGAGAGASSPVSLVATTPFPGSNEVSGTGIVPAAVFALQRRRRAGTSMGSGLADRPPAVRRGVAWVTAAEGGAAGAAGGMGLGAPSSGERTEQEWDQEIDELMKLVQLLPPSVRSALEDHPAMLDMVEVVMDLGRPPLARFPEGDVKLSQQPITADDLEFAVAQVGEFGGDNRAGIDRTLHRISCMRNRTGRIIGLTCRVGRAVKGGAQMVRDLVLSGASILLLGRPGVGKTTAIREVSRMLADECTKRVVIVDTSNEIGGDGDIPHSGIGRARRMQVPAPEAQHRVMIEAVENHMPQVIVIDEIGTSEECSAARTIAQRGVQLVATAHGNELENVIKNPQLADLVGGIQSVTLGDDEAKRRGVQKSILERAAPPTFDVCIEMLERTKWRVHLDVGQAVDVVLAGGDAGGQVRERAADGTILKYNYNPAISGVIKGASRLAGGPGLASGASGSGTNGGGYGNGTGASASADLAAAPRAPGSSFIRSPVASVSASLDEDSDGAAGSGSVAGDGDFGAGKRLRRVTSRQAVAGISAESAELRLFIYELDEDVLWEVMTDMRLVGKVFITTSLASADAVLALRAKVKHNSELRAMAREEGVPIYAVKTSGNANLVKAFRTLLGIDPSAGGTFGAPSAAAPDDGTTSPRGGRVLASGSSPGAAGPSWPPPSGTKNDLDSSLASVLGSDDEGDGLSAALDPRGGRSGSGGLPGSAVSGAKGYGYKAWAEEEAVEEAQLAVTEIVMPLQQPVELMPRAQSVLGAQIRLLERYKLSYEIVGAGAEARLRILPRTAAAPPAATTASAPAPTTPAVAGDTADESGSDKAAVIAAASNGSSAAASA